MNLLKLFCLFLFLFLKIFFLLRLGIPITLILQLSSPRLFNLFLRNLRNSFGFLPVRTILCHVLRINGEMSCPVDLWCGAMAHGLTMPWHVDSRCSDVACGLAVPRHVGSRCSDMSCGLLLRRCAYWGLLYARAEVCRLLCVLAVSGLLHVHARVLAT